MSAVGQEVGLVTVLNMTSPTGAPRLVRTAFHAPTQEVRRSAVADPICCMVSTRSGLRWSPCEEAP